MKYFVSEKYVRHTFGGLQEIREILALITLRVVLCAKTRFPARGNGLNEFGTPRHIFPSSIQDHFLNFQTDFI